MSLLIRLAARNVFRNRRRTFLTVSLIGIGLAALMVTDGLIIGINEKLVRSVTQTFLGHAQIHTPSFKETRELEATLKNPKNVENILASTPQVASASKRIFASGMLASSANVSAVGLYGVEPDKESKVSRLKEAVIKGNYLSGEPLEIMVGDRLAELLEVGIGDRLVVTLAQAHTGELSQELFRVSGIFRFNNRQLDQGVAFTNLNKAQSLTNLSGQYHEVVLRFSELGHATNPRLPIWQQVNQTGNTIENWRELAPSLSATLEMSEYSIYIVAVILFAIIALGVVNTLFMAIYERMFEFGVIKGVGTRPRQLAGMVLLETVFLAIFSVIFGLLLGSVLIYWLATQGIDYSDIEMVGVSLDEPIYLHFTWTQYTSLPLLVFALTVLSGIYPAIHAARITPAEALRKSL